MTTVSDHRSNWVHTHHGWAEDRAQRDLRRNTIMARFARVLSMADSVLSGEPVACQFVAGAGSPASSWTDGETIRFSIEQLQLGLRDMEDEDVIYINGLNYHELAHHLFTPRKDTNLGRWAVQEGPNKFSVYNMLEDQRIERLLIAMYPSVRPFLHNIVLRFVLGLKGRGASADLSDAFPLMHGRRYIPEDIRNACRDQFRHQEDVQQLGALIDEYIMLVFPDPNNEQRAKEIVEEVLAILRNHIPPSVFGHSSDNTGVPEGGKTEKAAQEEAQDWAQWYEQQDEEEDEDEEGEGGSGKSDKKSDSDKKGKGKGKGEKDKSDSDSDDADSGGGSGKGDKGKEGDAGGTGDGADSDSDGSGQGSGQSDTPSDSQGAEKGGQGEGSDEGQGLGAGSTGSSMRAARRRDRYKDAQDVRNKMRKSIKAIGGSTAVKQEIADKRRYFSVDDGGVLALPVSPYGDQQVDATMRLVSSRFAEEVERLRADTDPGWNRNQPSGRINMKAAMSGVTDPDVLFDQWDADKMDATRIASAICLDSSGSMAGAMDLACQVSWVIKHAIEKVDGVCMLAQYDTTAAAVYSADEKADIAYYRGVEAGGGTMVAPALIAVEAAMQRRTESNKMIWILTDGDFSDAGWAQGKFPQLRAQGMTVVLFGIGAAAYKVQGYESVVDHAIGLDTLDDMVPAVRAIVMDLLRKKVGTD